ncbi:uncharacterized protein LOC129699431 isoform X2 [Leucoraja erinacea]|nr:uncharacterized protein LOC129699431 isoform X2 [Leucoraja erinacea]XP_055495178.1 uncharacterized protein LOC129699431 isoform X2 [Leucoraja erinacea]XP_055495179.1 uncharacterized protein LOC129699431 isoform X2 [Leucoraja erinacea]XP_055495180.1 uncharacterized protein LOC129699431 isoform X2 [Leucoraja erinacea]
MGGNTSKSLTLSTGSPPGLRPQLPTVLPYTHDCVARFSSNSIIKFADDTVVVGLISDNDEKAYWEEVADLALWCQDNNLLLNIKKTKELIVDFKRAHHPRTYTPLKINGDTVDRASCFKYLGVHISEDMTWTSHAAALVNKARQRLYYHRQLRKFRVSPRILQCFYSASVESILSGNITIWFGNCSAQDKKALQRLVRSAERTMGTTLAPLQELYIRRCNSRANKIMGDSFHPSNGLFQLLRSGKHLRCHAVKTERMRRSFFPEAIRTVNSFLTRD